MNGSLIGLKFLPFVDGTFRKTLAFTNVSAAGLLTRSVAGAKWGMRPPAAPGALTDALAGAGAGNVDNGEHKYVVTFVTADGETVAGTVSGGVTVVDKTVNGQVALSAIPTGRANTVKARKVYRSKVGDLTAFFLLTTISDNTTTTYTDNTADAGLGAEVHDEDTSYPYRLLRLPSQIVVDTDQRVYIGFGATSPTITSGNQLLEIGERQIVDVPEGSLYIGALRAGSSNGTLGYSQTALYMDSSF